MVHKNSLKYVCSGYFTIIVAVLSHLPVAFADWTYKSRPDLSPPTLNITVPASSEVSDGYIFITPYSDPHGNPPQPHGPLQIAPYIFTSTGELVWSGFGYFGLWSGNFQAGRYQEKDVLFAWEGSKYNHGHGHGHGKILDSHYETIKQVNAASHALLDTHEFQILDGKTALAVIYQPKPFDLKTFGVGPKSQWIVDAIFQEVEIKTGRLLFEWSSLDYILPSESIYKLSSFAFGTGHNSSNAIDYFHLNSVDRDAQHNYLISSRHTSTIYKINGTSGAIIWRLGGKRSNFTLDSGVEFNLQHHARFISRSEDNHTEIISLFDNAGSHSDQAPRISSGKILSLNTQTWTATLLQSFQSPDKSFAASQGNTQILPNGNAFINWGSLGSITEFSPNGSIIFHAYLDSGDIWTNSDIQNYRGFKFNWTGIPKEDPAVVALKHGESTMVYVSWNGDTETKSWRFYGIDGKGGRRLFGEESREGFETGFYVRSGGDWIGFLAEAVGVDGKILRRSRTVSVEPYIYQYVPGRDDFTVVDGGQAVLGNNGGEI